MSLIGSLVAILGGAVAGFLVLKLVKMIEFKKMEKKIEENAEID